MYWSRKDEECLFIFAQGWFGGGTKQNKGFLSKFLKSFSQHPTFRVKPKKRLPAHSLGHGRRASDAPAPLGQVLERNIASDLPEAALGWADGRSILILHEFCFLLFLLISIQIDGPYGDFFQIGFRHGLSFLPLDFFCSTEETASLTALEH